MPNNAPLDSSNPPGISDEAWASMLRNYYRLQSEALQRRYDTSVGGAGAANRFYNYVVAGQSQGGGISYNAVEYGGICEYSPPKKKAKNRLPWL
jgi:hypothetical protein